MYLEPLVLVGRGLVLGELTFKNRGQFGSRFFWIGFSWFFLNAELQPLANWQRWLNLSDYFFSMRWGPTLCFLAIKSEGTNRPQDSSEVPTQLPPFARETPSYPVDGAGQVEIDALCGLHALQYLRGAPRGVSLSRSLGRRIFYDEMRKRTVWCLEDWEMILFDFGFRPIFKRVC